MALTFVECPGSAGKSTTVVVNLAAANVGDLLVAITGSSDNQTPTISGSGWTNSEHVVNGTVAQLTVWWKIAGASEPTSITFTYGSAVPNAGCVYRITGAAASPFVNDSGGATGSDATAECGTAGGGSAAGKIAAAYWATSGTASGATNGYSVRGTFSSASQTMIVADDLADGTSEGTTITLSASAVWAGSNASFAAAGSTIFRLRADGKY